jgi:hypothetical protein
MKTKKLPLVLLCVLSIILIFAGTACEGKNVGGAPVGRMGTAKSQLSTVRDGVTLCASGTVQISGPTTTSYATTCVQATNEVILLPGAYTATIANLNCSGSGLPAGAQAFVRCELNPTTVSFTVEAGKTVIVPFNISYFYDGLSPFDVLFTVGSAIVTIGDAGTTVTPTLCGVAGNAVACLANQTCAVVDGTGPRCWTICTTNPALCTTGNACLPVAELTVIGTQVPLSSLDRLCVPPSVTGTGGAGGVSGAGGNAGSAGTPVSTGGVSAGGTSAGGTAVGGVSAGGTATGGIATAGTAGTAGTPAVGGTSAGGTSAIGGTATAGTGATVTVRIEFTPPTAFGNSTPLVLSGPVSVGAWYGSTPWGTICDAMTTVSDASNVLVCEKAGVPDSVEFAFQINMPITCNLGACVYDGTDVGCVVHALPNATIYWGDHSTSVCGGNGNFLGSVQVFVNGVLTAHDMVDNQAGTACLPATKYCNGRIIT